MKSDSTCKIDNYSAFISNFENQKFLTVKYYKILGEGVTYKEFHRADAFLAVKAKAK